MNEPEAMPSPVTCKTALPVLCNVSGCALAAAPAAAVKLSAVGDSVTAGCAGAVPLPVRATSGGLVPVEVTCKAALRAPTAAGLNASWRVQLEPWLNVALTAQVPPLLTEKSAKLAPARVKPDSVTAPGPWLSRVTVCVVATAPTVWLPNDTVVVVGVHDSSGDAATPVPLRLTACGEPAAFEVTETLPEAAPRAVGVKVTDKAQFAVAARLVPQLWLTAKPEVAVMPEMPSAAVPVLVKVTLRAVEVTLTVWFPKASDAVDSVTAGAGTGAPVPDRLRTALPLLASEASVSVALRAPAAAGVKLKVTVQLAPTASTPVGVQVPPRVKSPDAVPVSVSPLKVSAALPLLLTVTDWLALVVPSTCEAKVSVAALSEICGVGAAVPEPLSVTADGEPLALCVIVRLALRAPVADGVNASLIVHELDTATLPPTEQVPPAEIWNSAACAPPSVSVLITSGAVPVLLTVTVWSAEVVATVWLKLSVVGDTPITGVSATPVPDRLVVLCPPAALCVTIRLALRAPAAEGVNPTLMVQLLPAATVPLAAQVPPLIVNSVPLLIDNVPRVNGALPVLESVTVCAEPAVPTFTLP